jgi:TRAP-type C4-dicarboxylate transport system substrate-binding protein
MQKSIAAAACAAIGLWAAGAHAQEVTLRLHHFNPPATAMHSKFIVPWTQMVAQESGGKIKIDIYPALQLGGRPQQLIDQIRDGVVDITWTLTGYTPGRFPRLEVFELPFVHQGIASTNKALVEFREKHLQEEMKDYKVLALHVHAGNVLISRDRPIRTLEDFKGLKFRTPNQTGSWFLEAAGANPVGTTITEVPQLLSRGVIDAAALPFEIIWPFKLHELTKYHTELDGGRRFQTTVFMLGMNKKKYEGLSPELRGMFDSATGGELVALATRVWEEAEEPGIQAAKARGNTFIKMSAAETERLVKLAQPVYDRWIAAMKEKNIDGAAILEDAKEMIAKHEK